ncbi:MAG: rubredoxin [Rhodospirillales bacterium]
MKRPGPCGEATPPLSRRGVVAGGAAVLLALAVTTRGAAAQLAWVVTSGVRKCPNTECGHVFDPALGDPDRGIPPGTRFEDLPAGWTCPECALEKALW